MKLMNRKNIIIAAVAVIIVVGGIWWYLNSQKSNVPVVVTPMSASSTAAALKNSYTLADVAKHAIESDCWTAIDARVYDVTAFIPSHPGGQQIVKVCGKDGSRLFHGEREHVDQNAQAVLDTYLIGVMKS